MFHRIIKQNAGHTVNRPNTPTANATRAWAGAGLALSGRLQARDGADGAEQAACGE